MTLLHLCKHNYLSRTGFYGQQAMVCDCNRMRARILKFPQTLMVIFKETFKTVDLRVSTKNTTKINSKTLVRKQELSIATTALKCKNPEHIKGKAQLTAV